MTELMPLTSEELDMVAYFEEHWLRYHRLPELNDVKRRYTVDGKPLPVEDLLKNPTFQLSLSNRGIPLPTPQGGSNPLDTGLSREQIAAIQKFLDIEDRRTLQTKLKEVGVTTTQWYGWMKQKRFKEFVLDASTEDFEENIHEAQMGLRRAMDRGETAAIKFYYELTKRYNSSEGAIGNLKVVISQIIEAVQRHVTDPETLASISRDFEAILGAGGTKPIAIIEHQPEIRELI